MNGSKLWIAALPALALCACRSAHGAALVKVNSRTRAALVPPDPGPCPARPERRGEATYYAFADGSGKCSFAPSRERVLVAALSSADFGKAESCGACVRIEGPHGEVTARVVDQCPKCRRGDLDLSREAFERIAKKEQGRVRVRWSYVPCSVHGTVRYQFVKDRGGSWTAIQVQNHRHAIRKLEYWSEGCGYVALRRASHNVFVRPQKMGPGPYTFRVSDELGNVLIDRDVEEAPGAAQEGRAQFPDCTPVQEANAALVH